MEKVIDYLKSKLVLNNNDYIVLAVSTGVDSMVLLNILERLQVSLQFKIIVCHINHNKRLESEDEYQFIKEYCELHNHNLEYLKLDKEIEGNFHNEARNLRYQFFNDICLKYNSKYLFTAHHGDDQVETILQRIIRGSSFYGYAGIKQVQAYDNYELIRPLLSITKDEIIEYATNQNIRYYEDNSNLSKEYQRNRLRHDVIPLLKEENNQLVPHFQKLSDNILEYYNYIENIAISKYDEVIVNNRLLIDKFKENDSLIQKHIISYFLTNNLEKDLNNLIDLHVDAIYNIVYSNKPNIVFNLPNNYLLIKEYNYIYLDKNNNDSFQDYNILFDGEFRFYDGLIKKEANIDVSIRNNNIIRLDSSEIKLPLYIRNRRPGDYIEVLGMNGSKKIKDVFIDIKLPKQKRAIWPILVDSNNQVLWVPSIKKSKYDKNNNQKYDIVLKYYM